MEKKRRVTIKDIAEAANVSISSVHQALYGKTGVSESTRQKVRQIAEQMDYKPNLLASSLKRETKRIAILLPEADRSTRFFYQKMWEAAEDFEQTAQDYNVTLKKVAIDAESGLPEEFDPLAYDGIISAGMSQYFGEQEFRKINQKHIPLILVDSDVKTAERVCCVQADTHVVGRVSAELLLDMIHRVNGKVLVSGIGPSYENRVRTEEAICEAFEEEGLLDKLFFLNFDTYDAHCLEKLKEMLRSQPIIGACAVNSRSTLVLGQAIEETGMKGCFPFVGNGLFEESKEYLRSGIITAIVDKKPYKQCSSALEIMTNLLVKHETPKETNVSETIDVIFKSTVNQY